MIIELAICSDLRLTSPLPASGLVTGVHMDIKQQVNSDYDWSASPALDQKNMSLHIGIKSEVGPLKLSRSWELIISNRESILTGILKLFWKFKMIH